MFKKTVIGFSIALAGVFAYVALQPGAYRISRQISINAAPDRIFPYLNHAARSNDWMPWTESDPQAKMIYSGPAEGVGAKTAWDSPGSLGKAETVIVESVVDSKVVTEVKYERPMSAHQVSTFMIHPEGASSVVEWTVTGENDFMARLMGTFFDIDKYVGGEFEKGLTKLKALVESAP